MSRPATNHVPLNLKMSPDAVRLGKTIAQRRGTTVSALVSEVFSALARLETETVTLHPVLEQLAGIAPDLGKSRQDVVMDELERKYGSAK